jgi:uncharacterized membrane protein YedE/YeeE
LTRPRLAGALLGIVFGVTLSWSGMAVPDVLRAALLLQQSYLFLMFASAVLTATVGLALLRRTRDRAALTRAPLSYGREQPARRHVVGSLLFGLGWGIADACPGPVAAQIGQGIPWAVFTLTGLVGGVWLYLRRDGRETEPATDPSPDRRAGRLDRPRPVLDEA